jgi:dimethylargininase
MFTQAIVRTPGSNAADGLTTARELGRPDHSTLLAQHAAYVQTLRELGLSITHLDPLEGHPDAYFVEDAALMFAEVAIVTRPGAAARIQEAEALAPTIAKFRRIERLTAPATLDGGDVLMVGKNIYVGLSERTNAEGAKQLSTLLAPHGYEVKPIPVPAGLHLKSSVTWAGGDTLVITRSLVENFPGYRHLIVPDDESYAANILWVNGTLLMPRGFPRTRELLETLALPIRELDQSEVQKMDGALTCMSLRF